MTAAKHGDSTGATGAWLAEALPASLDANARTVLLERLEDYLDQLQRWGAVYNLTSVRGREALVAQHLLDSLSVVGPLRRHLAHTRHAKVLDVGSGAGLPGLVIALACPEMEVTCIDAVAKKASFVRQFIGRHRLANAVAVHGRVEAATSTRADVVISRAFATLTDFVRLTRSRLARDGVWMAMKGVVPDQEIAELPSDVRVFHVEQIDVKHLEAERCLVWLRPDATMNAGRPAPA